MLLSGFCRVLSRWPGPWTMICLFWKAWRRTPQWVLAVSAICSTPTTHRHTSQCLETDEQPLRSNWACAKSSVGGPPRYSRCYVPGGAVMEVSLIRRGFDRVCVEHTAVCFNHLCWHYSLKTGRGLQLIDVLMLLRWLIMQISIICRCTDRPGVFLGCARNGSDPAGFSLYWHCRCSCYGHRKGQSVRRGASSRRGFQSRTQWQPSVPLIYHKLYNSTWCTGQITVFNLFSKTVIRSGARKVWCWDRSCVSASSSNFHF